MKGGIWKYMDCLFYKKNQIIKSVLYKKMVLQRVTCYSLSHLLQVLFPSLPEGDILLLGWAG